MPTAPDPALKAEAELLRHLLAEAATERDLIKIDKLRPDIKKSHARHTVRLALVSNSTTDFLLPVLRATALQRGIYLEIMHHDYGQAMEFTLNTQSAAYADDTDAILVCFDYRILEQEADEAKRIVQHLRAHSKAVLFIQTIPNAPHMIFGNEESRQPQGLRRRIQDFNALAAEQADYLVDTAYLADYIGLSHWHNDTFYHMAKLPFDAEHLPAYGNLVARSLALSRGMFGKCLVLDLDNTLWGGVIGDDGLENIKIGQGSAAGEAFLHFQRTVLEYKKRGVILAVCSKNEEAIARSAFREHPAMLLREADITVFVANWNDKASNIRYIAETLNIGLDSLVFVDDNPAEREQVRQVLPEVAVLELPKNPADYSRALMFSGMLESMRLTAEDLKRTEQYAMLQKGEALLKSSANYDDYLQSLEMTGNISGFDAIGRMRITQLINKTNQFNLTTRRYTEAEVEALEQNPSYLTYQVRLADKFGDHGMIGAVIARLDGDCALIDTWLMSCRVLKRGVENMTMNRLVRDVLARGGKKIVGTYIPTQKNAMVSGFFGGFGFVRSEEGADGKTTWTLETSDYAERKVYIKEGDVRG